MDAVGELHREGHRLADLAGARGVGCWAGTLKLVQLLEQPVQIGRQQLVLEPPVAPGPREILIRRRKEIAHGPCTPTAQRLKIQRDRCLNVTAAGPRPAPRLDMAASTLSDNAIFRRGCKDG